MLCSPTKRTRQTWHGVAVALAAGSTPTVRYERELYEGDADDLLAVLRRVDKKVRTVLLIGHNPAVSQLSAMLDPAGVADSDGLRTSGIAVHRCSDWRHFGRGEAALAATHTARSSA